MAVEAIDIPAACDSGNYLRAAAVMTGGTGTGAVGTHIMLSGDDFVPVPGSMAIRTELSITLAQISLCLGY